MSYQQMLKDPSWLKKRESLIHERGYKCQSCERSRPPIDIHHGYYRPTTKLLEYEDQSLWILCRECHLRFQVVLAEIHQIIGHVDPTLYADLKLHLENSVHEFEFGITKDDLSAILAEDQEAESTLYSEYSLSIISSTELGPTVAYDLEDAVRQRFPGIESGISTPGGERDGIVSVSGPDPEITSMIEAWCHQWNGQF